MLTGGLYMENPFTLTFGKEPMLTIRREEIYFKIIDDFTSNNPSSQTYILIGARGAGKTVLLTEQYDYFKNKEDWIVADVNPHRNILEDLASQLYEKGKLKNLFIKKEFDFSFHGVSLHLSGSNPISSVASVLDKMLSYLKSKEIKVLITLDEVVSNENIKEFSHDFQSFLRKGYGVFLLVTGLFENVYSLQNDKSLTFLYRAPKILLKPLDLLSIKNSYKNTLGVNDETAVCLAKLTNGYGFGYQLIGHLFFERKVIDNSLLEKYDELLKINAYDKIWSSVGENERKIILSLFDSKETKTSDILLKTGLNNSNYSVFRDRLIQKGIVDSPRNGYLSLSLPRFKEFIQNNILLD